MVDKTDTATGMRRAANLACGMQVAFTEDMTPAQAAECMRDIIVKSIRAHAEAIEQSAFEREWQMDGT